MILQKWTIEHRVPIIVEFFFLQYANLRTLECYYKFFEISFDVIKFGELQMATHALYLALVEEKSMIAFVRRKKMTGKSLEKNTAEVQKQTNML